MEVVGDLLARTRRSRAAALVTGTGSERTYRDVITNAYKAANVLRYLGAREGSTVAIAPEPRYHTVLAFLGGARLGARIRFDPDAGLDAGDRVVLVDADRAATAEPRPGTNLAAFGGSPNRPGTTHWEAELWSENPGTPPSTIGPDDPLLVDGDRTVTHAELLAAASDVVTRFGLDDGSRVVVRTSFAAPGTIVAGVVAPLRSDGATVLVDAVRGDEPTAGTRDESTVDRESRGDLAVVVSADRGGPAVVPEPARIDPDDVVP